MKKNFNSYYNEHKDFMYQIAYTILKDSSAAELAVQKAFIRIHKNFRKVKAMDDTMAKQLAMVVTKRAAIDIYRQRQNPTAGERLPKSCIWKRCTKTIPGDDVIIGCIQKLPKKYKDVLTLKYAQEYRTKEIAHLLGTSPKAVRSYILRGKKLLRKEFIKGDIDIKI